MGYFAVRHRKFRRFLLGIGLAGLLYGGFHLYSTPPYQTSLVETISSIKQKNILAERRRREKKILRLQTAFQLFLDTLAKTRAQHEAVFVHSEERLPFLIERYQKIVDHYEFLLQDIEDYDKIVIEAENLIVEARLDRERYERGEIDSSSYAQLMRLEDEDDKYLGYAELKLRGKIGDDLRYIAGLKEDIDSSLARLEELGDESDHVISLREQYTSLSSALKSLQEAAQDYYFSAYSRVTGGGP